MINQTTARRLTRRLYTCVYNAVVWVYYFSLQRIYILPHIAFEWHLKFSGKVCAKTFEMWQSKKKNIFLLNSINLGQTHIRIELLPLCIQKGFPNVITFIILIHNVYKSPLYPWFIKYTSFKTRYLHVKLRTHIWISL